MYPSRQDLETRPQVVRRRDSLHCLDVAAEWRAKAMIRHSRGRNPAEYDVFLDLAKQAIWNARRYDATARLLGLRIPGEPDRRAA